MQKASNICLRHYVVVMNVGLSRRRPFVHLMMPRSDTHIYIFSHQSTTIAAGASIFQAKSMELLRAIVERARASRQNDSICAER
jgi:hypothetical protein